MAKKIWVALLGTVLSAGIAGVSFLFIIAESSLIDIIWHNPLAQGTFAVIHHIFVCCAGLVVVYFLKKRWGSLPRTTHDNMAELKQSQTVTYTHVWRDLLVAIVILASGAGVGPEASLLGAIIALSIWQADKLRYVYYNFDTIRAASFTQKFAYALHPRKFLLSYSDAEYRVNKRKKQALVALYIANGIVMFTILMRLTDQPSFVTRVGQTHWQLRDIVILPLLCLVGALVGVAYATIRHVLLPRLQRISLPLFWQLAIGTLAILTVSFVAPELMFSGQHEIGFILDARTVYPVAILVLLAFVKLVFCDMCLLTGWVGGDIFPVLFSSLLVGFAVSRMVPGYDTLFVCIVVAVSMSAMLVDLTWVMCIIVALFFPVSLLPIALVSVALLQGVRWCAREVMRVFRKP